MTQEIPYDVATILNICGDAVNDEILDRYQSICYLFSELNYIGHVLELDYIEMLLASQAISTTDAIQSVNEVIYTSVEEILHQLGIEIDPDTELHLLEKLLSTYGTFDPTEFPQTILDIVEASEDPIECCAEVLDFITSEDTSVWYNVLADVTPEFVSNIKSVLLNAIDLLPTTPIQIDREFNKKRKLIKEVLPESELVNYTTESKDLKSYYELYSDRLQSLSDEDAIKELVTLAALAENAPDERLEALESILEEHIPDANERVRYNGILSKIKRDLEHIIYR